MKFKLNRESVLFFPIIVLCSLIGRCSVQGHGMLTSPRSRSYYASVEGATWGTAAGVPPAEYCPHCINLKAAEDVCGTGGTQSYDFWEDMNGDRMPWISQGTYTEGQDIFIEATLTTNHAGHFDVFVCPNGDASTQQCFLDNPLTFVEDMMHGGPVDENYPGRAYVSPATLFRFKYRLPEGIYGPQVMLQWRYVTANSCIPPGYRRPELQLAARGWLRSSGMADCVADLNWTGDRGPNEPEQFWNCADITILPSNPTVPTPVAAPSILTRSPVVEPPTVPTPSNGGCCLTMSGSNSCGPTWCSESKSNCEGTCGGDYVGGPTGPTPTIPTAPITPTAPAPTFTGSLKGTTTRYWDCSGGACGCAYLPFGPGSDNRPSHCYSNAMFAAPIDNPYNAKFYGTAAISQALGGGNWMAEGCGKCWKVRGWSNISDKDIFQTTLVLKGTNYCPPENDACSGNKAHFDIAAPGFDVTEYSLSNTCSLREPTEIEGFKSCGRWMIDSQNPDVGCDCSKFNDPVLRAGCENFFSLLWDNSEVDYEEVDCPSELSQLNCWEENGNKYPEGVPEFCASNIPSSPIAPIAPAPIPAPTPTSPPVLAPTPTPPVLAPTPPTTEYCCSSDLMNCKADGDWCALSIENCASCSAKWIQKNNPSCRVTWWGDCFNDRDGCCPPSTCHDYGTWAMCEVSPIAPVAPTPSPVTPTLAPVASTPSPITTPSPSTVTSSPVTTPAPVTNPTPVANPTFAPAAIAPVVNPTSSCACNAEIDDIKSEMAGMKSDMEMLKKSLEEVMSILTSGS